MLSLKNSLLRCKNHSEAQCIISSATVSLMGPETFLVVIKNITLDTNILCNDDARQVERKITQCNSRVRLVATMGFICQLDPLLDYGSF